MDAFRCYRIEISIVMKNTDQQIHRAWSRLDNGFVLKVENLKQTGTTLKKN